MGANPPRGAIVFYSLTKKAEKIELKVLDYAGQLVRKLDVKSEPGLHRATWDFARLPNANAAGGAAGGRQGGRAGAGAPAGAAGAQAESGAGGGGGGFGGFGGGQQAPSGIYRVVLTVDGHEFTQALRVEGEVNGQGGGIAEDEDENEEMEKDEMEQLEVEKIDLDRREKKPVRIDD